ncbi:hypothetical protein V2J09_023845 [Rumex salicifolius]
MEGGLPMLNCLLHHTLKSLCSSSESSDPSNWVYAVFWKILPRNFPPPKWEYGGGALDLINGNKRNWMLVWEDGYCDFDGCEQASSFGADVFFKMSHEVYNYGEGLMGKLAADNNYRWIFSGNAKDEPSCFSTWKGSIDPQPKAWEIQFKSGIQVGNIFIDLVTIALIPVREGMIQLGSLDKVIEDPKLVANTQRKFNYLLSIPGISAIPRPITINIKPTNPYTIEANGTSHLIGDKHQLSGSKRAYNEGLIETPIKSINLGWNMQQNGLTMQSMWSLPQLFPAFLSTMPYGLSPYDPITSQNSVFLENITHSFRQKASPNDEAEHIIKVEPECAEEYKPCCLVPNHDLDNSKPAKRSRFGTLEEGNLVH